MEAFVPEGRVREWLQAFENLLKRSRWLIVWLIVACAEASGFAEMAEKQWDILTAPWLQRHRLGNLHKHGLAEEKHLSPSQRAELLHVRMPGIGDVCCVKGA